MLEMTIYENIDQNEAYKTLLKRPALEATVLFDTVDTVLQAVKNEGDAAVIRYAQQFDKLDGTDFEVSAAEWARAETQLSEALKTAILTAKANIEAFHRAQITPVEVVETMPGIRCWRKSVGIDAVGLYIPGGTAPLFSTVLMLGVPAALAGCGTVVLCSPPSVIDPETGQRTVHPAVLFAAKAVGISKVYKLGGVQAIAAMAYGTETVPQVHKIFGPGNQYVTAAKQRVNMSGVAIDMPAGPSEVLVIADETAPPAFVAADLLSQAEHGVDSQVVLLARSRAYIERVLVEIEAQLQVLPRADLAREALRNSVAVVVKTAAEALKLSNFYAPEHLILATADAESLAEKVVNAGSVFIGHYAPESVGDYASGTNHTLPTNGFARAYSGVSVDSFVKKITFQTLSPEGLKNVGPAVIEMAEAEALKAHAVAVAVRLAALS